MYHTTLAPSGKACWMWRSGSGSGRAIARVKYSYEHRYEHVCYASQHMHVCIYTLILL